MVMRYVVRHESDLPRLDSLGATLNVLLCLIGTQTSQLRTVTSACALLARDLQKYVELIHPLRTADTTYDLEWS